MATNMTEAEWRAFLAAGTRTAKLATSRADGRPHLAPVWFLLEGDEILFNTGRDTVKGRNLARDGRVMICVDDDRPPFSYVLVQGTVELSEDLPQVRSWATRIAARYVGEDLAEQYGARNGVPGELLVRVKIDRVTAERGIAD
ncbi:PPOX class F420-dependent oxidoreductase [Kitasatospora sp. NPDC050543]|uniref:PPOX class F420-dependent oxidoreductase n=1 Tax=Kitasatospora sp. NPDC050543 TaxID=3364054 RepID=UPI0037970C38